VYAAFWLDPQAEDVNKRVVFCQPLCKKPTTAWAILRSAIHEDRTGGVLAGSEEELHSCIEQIDQVDQKWPDNAARIVSQITRIAQKCACTVVFRQNIKADGVGGVVSSLRQTLYVGQPTMWTENQNSAVVRFPLTGHAKKLDNVRSSLLGNGWINGDEFGLYRSFGDTLVVLKHLGTTTRASLEIVHPVRAANQTSKRNQAGYSEEFRFGFERLNEILDTMLGPTAKKFRFVLSVKEKQNTILFFGTKPAYTLRQAIEQYVDHLLDRPSSSEPKSSQPDTDKEDDSASDIMDEITPPPVANCRFWKL